MKLRQLALSALLTLSITAAQADNLNQPEMLSAFSATHMDVMDNADKMEARGEHYTGRYAYDNARDYQRVAGGSISCWWDLYLNCSVRGGRYGYRAY